VSINTLKYRSSRSVFRRWDILLFLCSFFISYHAVAQTFLDEDFSSGEMPPPGWTIDILPAQWTSSNTSNAGGSEPEGSLGWTDSIVTTRLISPTVDLSNIETVNFQFKHLYDDYDGEGPAVGIATRSGNNDWTSVWEILPQGNIGPETIDLEISNDDVGQSDFQICAYVQGNLWNLDFWYFDDFRLYNPRGLELTLLLEGAMVEGQMSNHLNTQNYLPLEQPFSGDPWYYNGPESVEQIPDTDITDWVLVELWKKETGAQPEYTLALRQAGFLLQDGRVTGMNGSSSLVFSLPEEDSLHLWIHHRNHFSIMSSQMIRFDEEVPVYDFTSGYKSAIYGKYAMKQISGDKWVIMGGDGNVDGQINNGDKYEVWMEQQGNSGYYSGDFNMDGTVDQFDLDKIWEINSGSSHWIPDTTHLPFPCGTDFIDPRDGQNYESVKIGNQCWMAENLNYNTGVNWCYYNSSSYCDVYGRLYDWNTIMQGESGSSSVPSGVQGICPEGWHIPSYGEWCILAQTVDSTFDCNITGYNGTDGGTKLKSTWGWSSGGSGTNESGFNALPGGCMGIYHFDDLYLFTYIWSTTEDYPGYAWLMKLNYGLPTAGLFFSAKFRGYSVRCVKD